MGTVPLLTLALLAAVLAVVVAGWSLIRWRPRLVIGERGILDRSLGIGWIRWDEIDGAYQRRQHDQDSLYIKLRGGALSLMRLKRRDSGGAGDLRLDLRGTSLSAVEVLQEILARSPVDTPGGKRILRDA